MPQFNCLAKASVGDDGEHDGEYYEPSPSEEEWQPGKATAMASLAVKKKKNRKKKNKNKKNGKKSKKNKKGNVKQQEPQDVIYV